MTRIGRASARRCGKRSGDDPPSISRKVRALPGQLSGCEIGFCDDLEPRYASVVPGVVSHQRYVQVNCGRRDPSVLALDRKTELPGGGPHFGPDLAYCVVRILDPIAADESLQLKPAGGTPVS